MSQASKAPLGKERNAAEGLFRDDSPYRPNSPYSATKASAAHLARAWRETRGPPTILTNCSNNYGPCHFPEKLDPAGDPQRRRGQAVAGLRARRKRA